MKKVYMFIFLSVITFSLWGQLGTTSFTSSISEFEEITGTVLGTQNNDEQCFNNNVNGTNMSGTGVGFPIAFPFVFNGTEYSSFAVHTNGWIVLGNGTFTIGGNNGGSTPISNSSITGFSNVICVLGMDLRARTGSSLSYQTIGETPNRTLVVQWLDYRYTSSSSEHYNFQIRLHETTNVIEYVYGNFTMSNFSRFPQVGIRAVSNSDYYNRETTDDWTNTTQGNSNTDYCRIRSSVTLPSGLSFKFFQYDPNTVPLPANCVSPADNSESIAIGTNLQWSQGSTNTVGYILSLGTNNPPTNIINELNVGLTTNYNIPDNLQYDTQYFWKVTPYNTYGNTESEVWTFHTTMNANQTTFPYNEGFEGSFPPAYWYMGESTTGSLTQVSTGVLPLCNPHRGNYMVMLNAHDIDAGEYAYIVTRPIVLEDGHYKAGFWMYRDNGDVTAPDFVELSISETVDFTEYTTIGRIYRSNILEPAENSSNAWHQYSFDVPEELANSTQYFSLYLYCANGNNMYIDDFFVKEVPLQASLVANPTNLDFGQVQINTNTPQQTITVTNNSEVTIHNLSLTYNNPQYFSIVVSPIHFDSLTTGEQIQFHISYQPGAIGYHTGEIVVTGPELANTLTLTFQGECISSMLYPPYLNTFETGYPESYWRMGYGDLQENSAIYIDTTAVYWNTGYYQNDMENANLCLKTNIIGNFTRSWLITPPVMYSGQNSYSLEFDLSVTQAGTSIPAAFSSDDKLKILTNDNHWNLWNSAYIISEITSPDSSVIDNMRVVVNLDGDFGSRYIAFYLESTMNNGNLDVFIDNFAITYHLLEPQNLTAQIQNFNDIILNWTAPAETRNTWEKQETSLNVKTTQNNGQTRDLLGYKIYRNLACIATLNQIDQLTYTDQVETGHNYEYTVTAVYTNGESRPTDKVMVNVPNPNYAVLFNQDFESSANFSANIANWRNLDLDGTATYSIPNVVFPGNGAPQAFLVFNPDFTQPAITDIVPFSGDKMLACFASVTGVNNDWLITPRINFGFGTIFRFWARSYSSAYSAEKIRVMLNTQDTDPAHFVSISNNAYFQIPAYWNEYVFDLSEYEGQTGYLAIQCISENGLALFLDDLKLISAGGLSGNDPAEAGTTNLSQNYPNPFNPSTTINYSLEQSGKAELNIYNIKGEKIKTLLDKYASQGNHSVKWDGKNSAGKSVSSGIYYYKLKTEAKTIVRKMILLK